MNILKNISILWAFVFTLVMFVFLFESRYSKKKTNTLLATFMIPLIISNFVLFILFGAENYLKIMIPLCTIPSFIFFWFLAKYRDGRFFFTFCMVDTVALEILYITNIIDYFVTAETNVTMFTMRIIMYPLLAYFVFKVIRPIYLGVQKYTKKGWYNYTAIGAIFYVAMTLSVGYPTIITERTEYLPELILLFVLMPAIYLNILNTLRHHQEMYEMRERESILDLQVTNLKVRMEEISAADEKFRMERHNFRHKMQTISELIDKEEYTGLKNLVLEYDKSIGDTKVRRYCKNAVIDAVFAAYIRSAENKDIRVTTKIVLPDKLGINETELATVIANALENAINACENVDEDDRYIDVQVIIEPHFMLQISNSFDGNIEFDENGVPANSDEEHGFGMRSILAFCEKNGAFYEFKAEQNRFALRIAL